MGNQVNRQDENRNQRKPEQPQQAENQGYQNQPDGGQKAKSGKTRDLGSQQNQNRQQPDQNAGTRH